VPTSSKLMKCMNLLSEQRVKFEENKGTKKALKEE